MVVMLEEAAGLLGGADLHELLRPISWKGVKGSARVKTGTMSYGRGLAGYIDTAVGRRLAFAIFFNDADEREALDAAFDPRVRAIDPESRPWRDRALKLDEADHRLGRAILKGPKFEEGGRLIARAGPRGRPQDRQRGVSAAPFAEVETRS
jgi:hypothetical protein